MLGIADVKAHLRVETDDDDALLTTYLAAAVEHVRAFTGVDVTDSEDAQTTLRLAALMLVASWFENREATLADAPDVVPFGFNDLLLNHRTWGFG